MKTFSIDAENNISVFATPEEAATATTTPFDSFTSEQELTELATSWPDKRLVAIWNSLPGVKPAKDQKVRDRKKAIARIWGRIKHMGEPTAKPEVAAASANEPAAQPEAATVSNAVPAPEREAAAAASTPTDAPAKRSRKARPAKVAPKAKKAAAPKTQEATSPREGSKTAQVVAMLQRKNGATIIEIIPYASYCTSLA